MLQQEFLFEKIELREKLLSEVCAAMACIDSPKVVNHLTI